MMKFNYSPGSCALASRIALEEAGAKYEAVWMDLEDYYEQCWPAYLCVNPKGCVPSLETERGVLTENPAILAYVAQAYPAANLAPLNDPYAFAEMQAFNSYLCSTIHVSHAHRVWGTRWSDDPAIVDAMKLKVTKNMTDGFALIENKMLKGPWVMGAQYTLSDPYLFTLARWLKGDGVDVARFPKVAAHMKRMEQRPAAQRALKGEG